MTGSGQQWWLVRGSRDWPRYQASRISPSLLPGQGIAGRTERWGAVIIARAEARGAAWSDGRGRERRDESIFATAAKRRERVGYD